MGDKELEKIAEEIEQEKIPEPIMEIAKLICPNLEEEYDKIQAKENYIILIKKVGKMEVIGAVDFDINKFKTAYSITIQKGEEEYPISEAVGLTKSGLFLFLKSVKEAIKIAKDVKILKKFYKLPTD